MARALRRFADGVAVDLTAFSTFRLFTLAAATCGGLWLLALAAMTT